MFTKITSNKCLWNRWRSLVRWQQRSESHSRRIPTHSVQAQVTAPSLSLMYTVGLCFTLPAAEWRKHSENFIGGEPELPLSSLPVSLFSLSLSFSLPPTLYLSFTVVVRIFTSNENWNCYTMRGGDRGREEAVIEQTEEISPVWITAGTSRWVPSSASLSLL